jgi:hypothetical protein
MIASIKLIKEGFMKLLLGVYIMLFSLVVQAEGKSGLVCGKATINLASDNYQSFDLDLFREHCIESLAEADACFFGNASNVAKYIINDQWDSDESYEGFLEAVASKNGKNISYKYIYTDDAYEGRRVIKRCR